MYCDMFFNKAGPFSKFLTECIIKYLIIVRMLAN